MGEEELMEKKNNNTRPLDDVQHQAAKEKSSSKRLKTADDDAPSVVMTFSVDHDRFANLQLLGSHTLYHLVSALCKYTPVGFQGSEQVYDHLWYISFNGNKYESSDYEGMSPLRANRTRLDSLGLYEGCRLGLTYDYGTTSFYDFTFLGQRSLTSEENPNMFPRNDLSNSKMPAGYSRYVPTSINGNEPLNLDTTFPHLQRFIFGADHGCVTVNLFQPGRRKNYGFMANDCSGTYGMLYLPAKPDDLANYLKYFNDGARLKPKGLQTEGYAYYNWHSVVILPRSKLTDTLERRYCENTQQGFCDAAIVADMFRTEGSNDLNAYFPKIAALAGMRKDSVVPKGWATLTKRGDTCNLVICSGNSKVYKSNAPKGTAYDGSSQHEPAEEEIIQVSGVDIRGLNDLFCVVEGLLMML